MMLFFAIIKAFHYTANDSHISLAYRFLVAFFLPGERIAGPDSPSFHVAHAETSRALVLSVIVCFAAVSHSLVNYTFACMPSYS
jgi:hypothetical protein